MTSQPTPEARANGVTQRAGVAIRRRLGLAFSAVLASLVLAFGVETYTLRRMDRIIDSMEDRDEEVQLALQIGAAIGEQYGHQREFLFGDGTSLSDYEESRHRALTLLQRLEERTHDPQSVGALAAVREATSELDRLFSKEVSSAIRRDSNQELLAQQKSYPLVVRAQESIDRNLAYLRASIAASRGDLNSLESASMRWLAAVLVMAAVLFAGAVVFLSRSVAKPVALLAKGAMILGRGDLDHRIPIGSRDDFGVVAAELNSMAAFTLEQRSRLVQSERLASVGRVAAGIAQEIRSPLHAIIESLDLDRRDVDQDLAARLGAVQDEALRCLQVVDGMLLLSRPEPIVDLRPVDLRQVCDDVSERLRPLAARAKVSLAVHGGGYALADRWKLRHALFNVVKNAVEAAGWEGNVYVQVSETEDGPHVRVSDTGPGIAPGLRDQLFEPLFTTKESGTGLGLAVSRAIVRAHGGDIDVWNGDQGGAVFLLHLPNVADRTKLV